MEARYAEVARSIVNDISTGKIPVGMRLPSEVELARHYDVSRATVRSALDVVESLGLISRRRRAGTRVEATQPTKGYSKSVSTVDDLVQYATETERRVQTISEIVCDEELADRIRCRPGQKWLRTQMLRIDPAAPTLPICWTDVYLEPTVGQAIRREIRQSKGLICDIVEQKCGRFVVEVKQNIRAIKVSAALAGKLNAEPDSSALEITRHYVDQSGIVFQITVSTHPADRFSYNFSLHRNLR
jgi:DNA-binding GntR family transcriptional regulator